VEHLGLEPNSISLQGKSADPARTPIGCLGGQTLLRVQRSDGEKGSDPRECGGAWGRFRAYLSAASTRRFHQISFPGEFTIGAADGNRTHVCAWALRLVHRAGLEPAEIEGTWATTRPRCRLSICACWLNRAGDLSDRPRSCWRKADGSNATPCGAHPFSRRGTGHSSGTFRVMLKACQNRWTSRRDLNARPQPPDGGALIR
jgi:hypothetical protein